MDAIRSRHPTTSSKAVRCAGGLVLALLALAVSTPAWAAHLVEVRVGEYDTFTRVVFELDTPSGYHVERNTSAEGGSEILVTLAAASPTGRVPTRSERVDGHRPPGRLRRLLAGARPAQRPDAPARAHGARGPSPPRARLVAGGRPQRRRRPHRGSARVDREDRGARERGRGDATRGHRRPPGSAARRRLQGLRAARADRGGRRAG